MPDSPNVLSSESRNRALFDLLAELKLAGYGFTTVSPATHARVNARPENASAADLRGIFGWSRPFRREILPAPVLAAAQAAGALVPDGEAWRSLVRVSSLGGDLYLHSAYPTRDANAVFFGPDTYRFARACAAWLTPEKARRLRRAVDIGTGAGPGAIVVAKAAPQAEVEMVDINDDALWLAQVNARGAGARNVAARRSDLLGGVAGEYDLIVSNPPYLNDPLERAYRHGGGPLGAQLSLRILDAALGRLAPGGTLLLYTGVAIVKAVDPFRQEAEERLRDTRVRWSYDEIDPDVFGEELDTRAYDRAERIAAVLLTATREE